MSSTIHLLDVRNDFRSGQYPFNKIQSALGRVRAGESLHLLVPFEPIPLFHFASTRGFVYTAKQALEGHWEVVFSRGAAEARPSGSEPESVGGARNGNSMSAVETVEVDARGLEPPQPMVRILETLAGLPKGATLRARTDRRPIHLYAQLEERGFVAVSEEQSDGSFISHIRHA